MKFIVTFKYFLLFITVILNLIGSYESNNYIKTGMTVIYKRHCYSFIRICGVHRTSVYKKQHISPKKALESRKKLIKVLKRIMG